MKEESKVVVIIPNMPGNGAKFTTTNLAHTYKKEFPTKTVALVDLNLKHPYLAESLTSFDVIHGVDNLLEHIDGGVLDHNLFQQNMVTTKEGVDVLKGTKLVGQLRLFSKKHIETIIEMLRELYDKVFISVASEIDNSATIYSLFNADDVVVVVRNNLANLKTLAKTIDGILNYKASDGKIKMLYNMHSTQSLADFGEIIREKDLNVIGVVPFDESLIDNVNLLTKSNAKFFKSKAKGLDMFHGIIKTLQKEAL